MSEVHGDSNREGEDSIRELTRRLHAFTEARDWHKFHSPKNLAMALAGEAGEVCALLQWVDSTDSDQWAYDNQAELGSELADVASYLLILAHRTGIDLGKAILDKLALNDSRYPVSRAFGNADKYNKGAELE